MGWIPDVVPDQFISSTAWGNAIRDRVVHTFASNAERNATAVPRPGMFAWSVLEFELACWMSEDSGWVVMIEQWRAWTPDVMVGAAHLPVITNYGSYFRRSFGSVEVMFHVDVGNYLAAVAEDVFTITPPFTPTGSGNFGVMTIHREGTPWLGPLGAFDEDRLACINNLSLEATVTASLVKWGDVVDGTGTFTTVNGSGTYTTDVESSG